MLRGTDPSRLSPPHQVGGTCGKRWCCEPIGIQTASCVCCFYLVQRAVQRAVQYFQSSWVSLIPLATVHWSLVTFDAQICSVHHRESRTHHRALPQFLAAASTLCRSGRLGRAQPKGSTSQIIHLVLCHPCDMICEAPQWCGCVAASRCAGVSGLAVGFC